MIRSIYYATIFLLILASSVAIITVADSGLSTHGWVTQLAEGLNR